MAHAILFYVFGYREAHLADLLVQEWNQQGCDVIGHAYCYRGAAAKLLRERPSRWMTVLSDREVIDELPTVPSSTELGELESRYGAPNLWRHAIWDRHLVTTSRGGNLYRYGSRDERGEILRIVAARLMAVRNLIEKELPQSAVFISIDIGSGSALALHQVAKYHGLAVTVPVPNRLGTGTLFFDDVRQPPGSLINEYRCRQRSKKDQTSSEAEALIDAFKSDQAGMHVKRRAASPPQDGKRLDRIRDSPKHLPLALRDRMARTSRRRYAGRKFSANPLRDDQEFMLMPLHLEPELALLAYAPEHYDQVATIRQVAQSTPASTVLAVREHPVVQGQRPISHYREISNIPNTVWHSPSLPSRSEMLRSRAVVSVTGSAVLEAAILGIPNLLLGRVWFDVCDSIHQSLVPADLPLLLANPDQLAPNEEDVAAFVGAILSLSTNWAVSAIGKELYDVPLDQARKSAHFQEYEAALRDRLQIAMT